MSKVANNKMGRPVEDVNLDAAAKKADTKAKHRRRQREALNDIGDIPAVVNPKRKAACGKLTAAAAKRFCRTYLPDDFTDPFTDDQADMVSNIVDCIKNGTWRAVAASRGDGKSTIGEGLMTYAACYGFLKFALIVAANRDLSVERMEDVKRFFTTSDLLYDDFPEICHAVRALGGSPQRAKMQTHHGESTQIVWTGNKIVFPMIPGSKAAGSVIECKTIEGAIRGTKHGPLRPGFALLDDIETDESAYSEADTKMRKRKIEKAVPGLAGKKKNLAIFMPCTIVKKGCIADEFTDPTQKPAYHGKRYKWLKQLPGDVDKWAKYMELRQADQLAGDDVGVNANKYYADNREVMDAGAIIGNPYRFNPDIELSALQACYNKIADMGWDNFCCEYQNDPPDELGIETIGININAVCKKILDVPRGTIPEWSEVLTCGIDVHGRFLRWVVAAWKQGMQGLVIDYGNETVHTKDIANLKAEENRKAVESAIVDALNIFADWEAENGWPGLDGEIKHLNLCLVDAGWMADAVGQFTRGRAGVYRPSMGFGSTQRKKYTSPKSKGGQVKTLGQNWHSSRSVAVGGPLYQFDADHYKNAVHRGFMTADGSGSISLYQEDSVKHLPFAKQVCAEEWKRELVTGPKGGYKEYFDVKHHDNHGLDALAQAMAAASMCGIRLLGTSKKTRGRRVGRVNR